MNIRLRIFCYFAAAFFPAFAGAHSAQTLADWLQALSLAAGAGFTALVAYFDHTDHNDNNPPPPGVPA